MGSFEIGKFLMRCKENWKFCMLLIKAICQIFHKEVIDLHAIDELESWIVAKSNLLNCWQWKALMNGKEMLSKYEQYGLAKDARLGLLNKMMIDQRLRKPKITIEELDKSIIEWLKQHPAPKKRAKNKKKKG